MSITSLIRPFIVSRARRIDAFATQAKDIQLGVLHKLVSKAADTEWGNKHEYTA